MERDHLKLARIGGSKTRLWMLAGVVLAVMLGCSSGMEAPDEPVAAASSRPWQGTSVLPFWDAVGTMLACSQPWERQYHPDGRFVGAPSGSLADDSSEGTWMIEDASLSWTLDRELSKDQNEALPVCAEPRVWSDGEQRVILCRGGFVPCDADATGWILISGPEELAARVGATLAAEPREMKRAAHRPYVWIDAVHERSRITYPPGLRMNALDEDVNLRVATHRAEFLAEELGIALSVEADPDAAANVVIELKN